MTQAATNTTALRVLRNGVTVIAPPAPRVDAEVAGDLRGVLLQAIESGSRKLILDMTAVEFIDSSGLGALVSALKRLKQLDTLGEIRLAGVQPGVLAVLQIIRLHRVFPTFASVGAATQSFQAAV